MIHNFNYNALFREKSIWHSSDIYKGFHQNEIQDQCKYCKARFGLENGLEKNVLGHICISIYALELDFDVGISLGRKKKKILKQLQI